MAKQKVEKLSLKATLGESLEQLYQEEGVTRFTVTRSVFTPSVGKAVWVERQLPLWCSLITEGAGVVVCSSHLERPWGRINRYGSYTTVRPSLFAQEATGKIILTLEVPGQIKTEGMPTEMAKAVSGAAKKQLAIQLLERFPLPFDPAAPLLAAGTRDFFHIDGRTIFSASRPEERRIEEQIIQTLDQMIKDAGAELVGVTCDNKFVSYYMTILWSRDVNDEDRKALIEDTKDLFRRLLNYEPDVYLWAW